ncbi:hypothetical protein R3P38DRAFT_2979102 [Favolaschia claudopus]|uniref:Uncharacterized protein n=1 Tax=Favolaschia claudopus TaxID=2862362 RepID=A0AAW0AZ38_9AGAR
MCWLRSRDTENFYRCRPDDGRTRDAMTISRVLRTKSRYGGGWISYPSFPSSLASKNIISHTEISYLVVFEDQNLGTVGRYELSTPYPHHPCPLTVHIIHDNHSPAFTPFMQRTSSLGGSLQKPDRKMTNAVCTTWGEYEDSLCGEAIDGQLQITSRTAKTTHRGQSRFKLAVVTAMVVDSFSDTDFDGKRKKKEEIGCESISKSVGSEVLNLPGRVLGGMAALSILDQSCSHS